MLSLVYDIPFLAHREREREKRRERRETARRETERKEAERRESDALREREIEFIRNERRHFHSQKRPN